MSVNLYDALKSSYGNRKSKEQLKNAGYNYGSNFLTFGKAQDLCNITISFSKVSNYVVGLSSPVSYPNVSYIFSIVGIPNDDDKLLTPQSRMDKNTGKIK